MGEEIEFKYFRNYKQWASFEGPPCACVGRTLVGDLPKEPYVCLTGTFFHNSEAPESVCLCDLVTGAVRVYIEDWVREELERSIISTHPDWSDEQVHDRIEESVDELSKTPPIPWIQNNNWPSCHGDFCRYLGEWDQEGLVEASTDQNGLAYLMSILREPEGLGDPEGLWEAVGTGWAAIYVFECLSCGQLVAIDQAY